MATIYLPKSTSELIQLGEAIISKHREISDRNEDCNTFINMNVKDLHKKLVEIAPKYQELMRLREISDKLNHEIKLLCGTHGSNRKISPGTVKFNIAQVRDILKSVYRENRVQLKDWGFDVTEKE